MANKALNKRLSIRASVAEMDRWRRAAGDEGLCRWVRRQLDLAASRAAASRDLDKNNRKRR